MTAKKKLIISITTLSIAIVAALGITFGVLAAQRQSVANQFSVTYTASNVVATVSARQKVKGGSPVSFVGPNNGSTVGFGVTSAEVTSSTVTANETLSIAEAAELTVQNNWVLYQFAFINGITAGGNDMLVELTDGVAGTEYAVNVNVTHFVSTTDLFDGENVDTTIETAVASATEATSYNVPAGNSAAPVYFYIYVEINDNTKDASYTSGTGHMIHFDLSYVANV